MGASVMLATILFLIPSPGRRGKVRKGATGNSSITNAEDAPTIPSPCDRGREWKETFAAYYLPIVRRRNSTAAFKFSPSKNTMPA